MPGEEVSYAQAMDRLEEIIPRIEQGDIGVDELGASVKEAVTLVKSCRDRLRTTRADVEQALKDLEEDPSSEG